MNEKADRPEPEEETLHVKPEVRAAAESRTLDSRTHDRLHAALRKSPTFATRCREILSRQPNDTELAMLVSEISMDLYDAGMSIVPRRGAS